MAAINFPKMEEEILKFWQNKKIFEKTLAKKSPKGNFVFFEGPPTANGKPGLHHIEARAFKDIICRYKTMRGYFVGRKAGWDTHGLPVELQIEKELKFSGKPDIEKYGIEKFNKKCKESVWYYKEEWEKMTERIAFWLDLEHPYITYENYYIESLWWILKQIWSKGLLYQGHKVVPQCPRCGTALSSHEVALGYKNIEETSVFVRFKVKAKTGEWKNTSILSWTTTPWTLPGNVALAINPAEDYICMPDPDLKDHRLVLGYKCFQQLIDKNIFPAEYRDLREPNIDVFKGKEMLGVEYEPLFDIPELVSATSYKVYPADFVTMEEGTGVVHTAVMYGEDDYNLGKKIGLPETHTVDENGLFLPSVKKWAGKFVKSVEPEIVEDLKSRGLLYRTMLYTHDYPFCWRCGTPLLYYAKRSWFIKMSDPAVKEKLLKNNQNINWVPDYIKDGRFGEWLREVKDWALTRERYWGTPLPVWQCTCGEKHLVGSVEELEKMSGKNLKDLDLHRPFIDEITFSCPKCGGQMRRTPEVLDCWFDSGSMPFAQWHYPFENKEKIDKGEQFPAEYISEAIDQTRGWFYTLLAVSTLLDRGAPYKNVICLGHLRDAKGEKMSKSKGNIVDPWDVINKYGSDAVRWFFYTINQPGDPKNFNVADVDGVLKKFFLIVFNVLSFYKLYANENPDSAPKNPSHILDKWILAKFNLLVKNTTEKLDHYDVVGAARSLQDFSNELSTWYLRRSRDRFKGDGRTKEEALATLRYIILSFGKIISPFVPFAAEKIYQEMGEKKDSIHLEEWPKVDKKLIDEKILEQMELAQKIVEAGLAARAAAGIKIRQPLTSYSTTLAKEIPPEYIEIIKDELNILELKFGEDKLDIELTEELKAQGLVREIVRSVNSLRKETGLTISDQIILYYEAEESSEKVLRKFEEKIKKETLSDKLEKGRTEVIGEKEIGGLWLGIKKI